MIRLGEADDADAIRELTRAAYAKWVPIIGREPKPMFADYARALTRHRFDCVEINGELAAVIETVMEGDCLLIENIAVSPPHQGRGLGRRLMSHAETLAISLGIGRLRLYTNKLFAENIEFYRGLGYGVDREEVMNGGVATHMSKTLSASHKTCD